MATIKAHRLIALILGLAVSLAVAHAETPEQIQALDREWAQACVQSDVQKLEQLLSDDLTYTHSSGEMQTKSQFITTIRDRKIRYRSIEFQQSSARVYDDTAVTNNEVRVNITVDTRDITVHARFLHVWAKHNGRWQLAAHQGTKID